jgi:hypothetical protein
VCSRDVGLRLGPVTCLGLFSNRVMNLWAVAAIAFVLLGLYVPALREALHFDAVAVSDLLICAAMALLWVAPAELRKVWAAPTATPVALAHPK